MPADRRTKAVLALAAIAALALCAYLADSPSGFAVGSGAVSIKVDGGGGGGAHRDGERRDPTPDDAEIGSGGGEDTSAGSSDVSGVSGRLFEGGAMREVPPGVKRIVEEAIEGTTSTTTPSVTSAGSADRCDRWAVLTTIFSPSDASSRIADLDDWCLVVVTDRGAAPFSIDGARGRVVVLDESDQIKMFRNDHFGELFRDIPWRHFGRKNLGFLYAIWHGAKVIWDFDDDNVLKGGAHLGPRPVSAIVQLQDRAECGRSFDPYPHMGGPTGYWPRGQPLDEIKPRCRTIWRDVGNSTYTTAAIYQSLADVEPDVDAIYRLTRRTPLAFKWPSSHAGETVALDFGVYCPFNAQATLFEEDAFWALLLPVTVHGRVSDIWRSYLAQRLLWDAGRTVAFTPPLVEHRRSEHDIMKDMDAEGDLYSKTPALIDVLSSFQSNSTRLEERYLQLVVEMYRRDFIQVEDVTLSAHWISALRRLDYSFPGVTTPVGEGITKSHRVEPLTFWTSDLHDGTRADFASMISGMGQKVLLAGVKGSRSPHPHAIGGMSVVIPTRPLSGPLRYYRGHSKSLTEERVMEHWEYYKDDDVYQSADAFVCMFPASMCEMFMPSGKLIIFLAAHRYSLGRCSGREWRRLNEHVTAMHERGHVVAAMSRYDAEYINYYTGIPPRVLTSSSLWYAGGTNYTKSRDEILIGPLNGPGCSNWNVLNNMTDEFIFRPVRQLYRRFALQDIANHRAVVLFPYAVMSYGITEIYSMSVPIFVPSIEFMANDMPLHDLYHHGIWYCGSRSRPPPRHPMSNHMRSPEDTDIESKKYWYRYADFFAWPHITTFSSFEDLIDKLRDADFDYIHSKMKEENGRRKAALEREWEGIFETIRVRGVHERDGSYTDALIYNWGVDRLQAT